MDTMPQENMTPGEQTSASGKEKRSLWIAVIIIAVIIVILGWIYWREAEAPAVIPGTARNAPADDTVSGINGSLNQIGTPGNLNQDFEQIDKDINQL